MSRFDVSAVGTPRRAFAGPCADRPDGIRLRPIGESDFPFLRDLYAQVRADELAPVPWPQEAKRAFLASQFELQHRHYSSVYVGADFLLIENNSGPIGRIYVHRTPAEISLMEVSLLPAWRGQGIGSALLHELLDEARASSTPVTLHVESFNPARRLYERHGFRLVENRGVYDFYRWQPVS